MNGFLVTRLPVLNEAVLARRLSLSAFVDWVRPEAEKIVADSHRVLTRAQARDLLQELAMIVASAERHYQSNGEEPGFAVQLLGVDNALMRLGAIADHPPRDSAYSYWTWHPMTLAFTRDSREKLFASIVNSTVQQMDVVAGRMRSVSMITTQLSDPEVVLHAHGTAEILALVARSLNPLARKAPDGSDLFSAKYFATEFRTWLAPWVVGNRKWDGPSAANFAAFFETDLRLAPASRFYSDYVQRRLETLPGEERRRVSQAFSEPTLEDRVLVELGQTRASLETMSDETVADIVIEKRVAPFLTAVARGSDALQRWTKIHLALVHKSLAEPAVAGGVSDLTVAMSKGTGGGEWREELPAILKMRRGHRTLERLFDIARGIEGQR